MMRFAEKVCQGKPHVERRVSKVNYLMIQQNQFAPTDKSVLRTEIAVNQAKFMAHGFLCQRFKEIGGCWSVLGGIKVIRLQSEALEMYRFCKRSPSFWPRLGGLAMDGTKKKTELFKVIGSDTA